MFAQVLIVDISVFAFHLSIDIKKKYSALHSRPHSVQAKCNIQINGCIFCAILKTIFQINGTWLLISLQCLNVIYMLCVCTYKVLLIFHWHYDMRHTFNKCMNVVFVAEFAFF